MYLALLKFSDNKAQAPALMSAHNDWIRQGLEEGVFLLVGSLPPNQGGAVLMHGLTHEEAQARLAADPFVAHNVVRAELMEIVPARTDARRAFLLEKTP